MQYLDKFIFAIIGVLGTGTGAGIMLLVKWPSSINKTINSIKNNVDSIVDNNKNRAIENRVQFQMMRAQGKAITALSTASKTIIEVTAKKEINGNVEKALGAIATADKELTEANQKYEDFADSLIGLQDIERGNS
jgi:hypothetical protein